MTFGGLVDGVLRKTMNCFFDDDFWCAESMQ